ncbi:MAG: transposase [Dehalococcoidia bacterium]|nr:transposase [Dehalococcoidia bacterium]
MTKPLTIQNYNTFCQEEATPPVLRQLIAVFDAIPEEKLLSALKVYYAGRNGYTYKVLWRTYVAMTILNLPSFAALIRTLKNNPYVSLACGITSFKDIPSKFAYSRFIQKLQKPNNVVLVKDIMRVLTRKCYEIFPNFGNSVAIDATDLKAWSNGSKKRKSDTDAGWVIKGDTHGKRKFVWGYKMHLMVDTTYELPVAAGITKGNTADITYASNLLSQARFTNSKFHPEYVICDAAYSSKELRHQIKRQYRAEPIIRSPKTHKKWIGDETPDWQLIFNRRTSVERVFGRMKTQRRLNNITVRNMRKVTVHSLVPVIVTQAMALAFPNSPRNCTI